MHNMFLKGRQTENIEPENVRDRLLKGEIRLKSIHYHIELSNQYSIMSVL